MIINNVLQFRKLLKHHPIRFRYVHKFNCTCSSDVDFADQGISFFLFLRWKITGECGQSAGCRRQPAAILNPAL